MASDRTVESDEAEAAPWWAEALRRIGAFRAHPWVAAAASLAVFALAVWVIHVELTAYARVDLPAEFARVGWGTVGLALAAVVASYAALAMNDRFALAMLGSVLPRARSVRASIAAYALSNALGWSFATAGSARIRLLSRWGLAPAQIGALSLVSGLAVQAGGFAIAGVGLVFAAPEIARHAPIPALLWQTIGVALTLPLVVLGLGLGHRRTPFALGGVTVTPPGGDAVRRHMIVTMLDWVAAAGVLYLLLPDHGGWSFPAFIAVFVLAQLLGTLSGAPGGIGVFEATILALAPQEQHTPGAAAALIIYRLIYTIGPLAVAAIILGADHAAPAVKPAARAARRIGVAARELAPPVSAALAFGAGATLLVSAATPSVAERIAVLAEFAPLALIELSHFLASVVGLLLLVIAGGLWRRQSGAFWLTLGLLAAGAAMLLLKGGEWEPALGLIAIAALLAPCRDAFTRQSRLTEALRSPRWMAAVAGALGATIWLGLFAFRHVEYSDDLWWSFMRDDDASRALRATTGAAVVLLVILIWVLITPSPRAGERLRADPETLARARTAINGADAPRPEAWLALLGDKELLFSETGASFIMFRRRGRRWIAMGEPVGRAGERAGLIRAFADAADARDAEPVFYAVHADSLDVFADQGFMPRKVGETALIDVADYTLAGTAKQNLRTARNKAEREGCTFDVLEGPHPPDLMEACRLVSDQWLARHKGTEKAFSLGRFEAAWLSGQSLALVRRGGEIIAFANLWTTPDRSTLMVDMMRFRTDAPRAIMEYLFVEAIGWAKANGYRTFDLGMAPLAGLANGRGAPVLSRLGAFVFENGEGLYGFQGLRKFKDKFQPRWAPVYLAAPPSVLAPTALIDVALLTSGGVRGLLARPG
jgi:phosphatidylglycerol lysyltransferase